MTSTTRSTPETSYEGPVLEVSGLTLSTTSDDGRETVLVDHLSFSVARGESFCLVGESGSGKSLTMLAVMGLLPPGVRIASGTIKLRGAEIQAWDDDRMGAVRGKDLAMVFQDPMTSLNPLRKVGRQIEDTLRIHAPGMGRSARRSRVHELLTAVGVPRASERATSFPHQWSGGMRQRAMIAMAMAHDPDLMIADEPTTALDVTIQAQVMSVLHDAQQRTSSGLVLITHDLGLVAGVADRVAIMYSGRIVETGTVEEIFAAPRHHYTQGLLASVLSDEDVSGPRTRAAAIPGSPPLPNRRPAGCAFAPRCDRGRDDGTCTSIVPPLIHLRTLGTGAGHDSDQLVACHHPLEPPVLVDRRGDARSSLQSDDVSAGGLR